MTNDFRDDLFAVHGAPIDPVKLARRDLQKALPRRFYTEVSVGAGEGGHVLLLDGKPVRTPAKALLLLPSAPLGERIAEEWRAQGEVIDPETMRLTRLVNSAIDGVARNRDATVAEVAKFAETDLVCYRAGDPEALVAAQDAAWDPVLAITRETLGARFICAQGILYVEQPASARAAIERAVGGIAEAPNGALKLAALSVMTSLAGSVLIALSVAHGHLGAEEAWAAAHVDEDYQARVWGADAEAMARRERRWREMEAAATVFRLA
jgi:chaperone required for assembly of F1-ATPase